MTTSKRTRKKFGKQRSFDWSLWDIELGRVLRNGKLKKARKSYLCFARSFAFIYKAEKESCFTILRACLSHGMGKKRRAWMFVLTHFHENRFSRDRPRFTDNLDVIKFLCKDLWTILFRKQIDNLKTNHRVCANSSSRTRKSP